MVLLTVPLLLYDVTCVLVLMRTFECLEVTSGIGISDSWAMHARSGKIHSKAKFRRRCSQNQEDAFFSSGCLSHLVLLIRQIRRFV